MSKPFVVYAKVPCGNCIFAKRDLAKMGVAFEEKRTDLSEEVREEAVSLGAKGAPFIIAPNGETMSGYDSKKLKSFVELNS